MKFFVYTFIFLFCLNLSNAAYSAEKKKRYCRSMSINYVNPILAGVEKVVVAVDVKRNAHRAEEFQLSLPKPLRKESLEALLLSLYEDRLRKDEGVIYTKTKGCHDRRSQPVQVIDYNTSEGRKNFYKATLEKNTLAALLHFTLTPLGYGGLEMDSEIASFYLSQMRLETDDYQEVRYTMPFSVTLKTAPEKIQNYIQGTLKNRIE